jgi:hypothetical protein
MQISISLFLYGIYMWSQSVPTTPIWNLYVANTIDIFKKVQLNTINH